KDLARIGVSVVEKPPYRSRMDTRRPRDSRGSTSVRRDGSNEQEAELANPYPNNPDERELQEALEREIHYVRHDALVNDVDSLAAIVRLRGGRDAPYLEQCGALFVSSNIPLVRAARACY